MFSGFTSSDRRKKVVYGKSSRLSTVPPPAPDPSDDAPPSPDRPRTQTATSRGALKEAGGTTKVGGSLANARAKADNVDIFDIPSEDEFVARPKPTKRLGTKPRIPDAGPGAQEEAPFESKKLNKPTQPLRKPVAAKPSTAPKKAAELPKLSQAPLPSSNSISSRMLRGKTPQPSELPKPTAGKAQQTTAPVSDATKAQNDRKTGSALPKKKLLAKPANVPRQHLDVFDVPSSEDEASLPVKKAPRQTQATRRKESVPEADQKQPPESDDSSASKKRKRRGSVSSNAAVAKPALRQKSGSSVPERNRKSQKKEDDDSPGYTSQTQTNASVNRKAPSAAPPATAPATDKSRRTNQRTVPMLGPPKTIKGQSSPAMLSSMLPSRQPAKPSPVTEETPVSELDDQTMYDIPDPMTTPVRAQRAVVPGSTTPRQRTLFSGLLGDDASASTPMPSISNLQLTDKKPRSLVGSLSRSKSDLTHSAQARKTRLIDTLKPAESSSDDDEESSSEDLEVRRDNRRTIQRPAQAPVGVRPSANSTSDDMDIEVQADSQTSQGTSGFGMRPKLTYAMSRSYLREANPEDDLMITMDLDDGFGGHSPSRDTVSASEDDPDQTSQAQAHHELKSRGRNYVFQQEAQSMIDDISSASTTSIRRNAMMELCTKMADETFCSQLLDSPLAHQFFRNISVGGEIVFEFATAVVTIFILRTNPAYSVLDQLHEAGILANLCKLLSNDSDIQKIAKDRKTNLSKIAKDATIALRSLVQQFSVWSPATTTKVTPQLVSMKAIELLVLGLRKTGNADALLDQQIISRLVEIATSSNQRLEANEGEPDDEAILLMVLSTLESISATRQRQAAWPAAVLQRIADFMPRFFQGDAAASTMLAVKLCMNLTNNKPKACQSFSAKTFVQPLVLSIIERFQLLNEGSTGEKRTETLESLILSLGATINLAEFSDQMRLNTDDNKEIIDKLVRLFLDGSERASQVRRRCRGTFAGLGLTVLQAQSVEESHSGVAIGYLAVLLGNLCLNDFVRTKIRALLPDQQLTTLIDSIKEFVRVHEHVDKRKEDFEGAEGQEALQSYTARLMLVVERLQGAT
ncbi:hypothetical protein yc1106_03106 [Curvularia clavata]|uniref:Wings apart-like protein C-terminal domain-containing protein n=1 Tax=Curvularia clavata TaxID=95742 RepID=A0A9Q9DQQ5_CURCL|nr:hypothetical protein yc1106_03106 [Curvularia clavata]